MKRTYIWYLEKQIGGRWQYVTWAASKDSVVDLFLHYASKDSLTKYRYRKHYGK